MTLPYRLYEKYICEIVLVIGCKKRWLNEIDICSELIEWISIREKSSLIKSHICLKLSDQQRYELGQFIDSTFVDVTVIKSCVRTLIRSSSRRRESILNFINSIYKDHSLKEEVLETLTNDFKSDNGELGYLIPVIPIVGRQDQFDINKTKRGLQNLAFKTMVNSIAINLNQSSMVLKKSEFESGIRKEVEDFYAKYYLFKSQDLLISDVKEGMLLGYMAFGLFFHYAEKNVFDMMGLIRDLDELPIGINGQYL